MILALIGLVIGALLGLSRARRAKGNRLDLLQYAAVYGIMFAVAGMIIAILIARLA